MCAQQKRPRLLTPKKKRRDTAPIAEGFVSVGRIVGVFGLEGFVKVMPLTDFPERLDKGAVVWLRKEPRKIRAINWYKNQARLLIEGINSVDDAEAIVGQDLELPIKERPKLPKDSFYTTDLIGLTVETTEGETLGAVDEVVPGAAQDLLRVGEMLIPMVKQFVKRVALDKGIITVELIPGMRPGEVAEEVRQG